MNIGELINAQAIKSGIASDNDALKDFLSNSEINKIVIPDEIAAKIQSSLLTVEQAKTNADLKRHFSANALDAVDAKIKAIIEEYGLDDDAKAKLEAEKSSYSKINILAKELQAAELKKVSATGGDKKVLVEEIAKLNAAIIKAEADARNLVSSTKAENDARITDIMLESHLSSYDYGNGMPKDVNVLTAKALLSEALAAGKAKAILDGKRFVLVNAEDTSLPYNENHAPVEFNTFATRLLNEKKMLKVSGDNNNQQQQQQFNNNAPQKVERPAATIQADERLNEFMKNY